MRRVLLVLLSGALISSVVGTANVAAAPRQGANELQLSGALRHSEGSRVGNLNADVSYGYYLSPGWQLGLRQAVDYTFQRRASDTWLATTTPFVNYHLRVTDIIVPYLGGFVGAAWNDRDGTGVIGPQAGVKLFVHDQAFVNLGYRYEWLWERVRDIEDRARHGTHVVGIGVGFMWGGR